ncbi:MAG: hypothetical protein ABTQ34_03495 [Bdellovibrionales bacterium]
MTTRDLLRNSFVYTSLAPAARVNGTATGAAVDLRNYDGAMVAVAFGSYTDGTHTPSLQHSADGVSYAAVPVADLDGAFTAVNSGAGANTVQQVGYVGALRFLQVVMTVTGATTGALSAASVVLGYPRIAPTQQG